MNYENILITTENNIATVVINRPTKLNALNKATITELNNAFKTLGENSEIQVIIVTGSGEKAFVAGADIAEFAHFSIEECEKLAAQGPVSYTHLDVYKRQTINCKMMKLIILPILCDCGMKEQRLYYLLWFF